MSYTTEYYKSYKARHPEKRIAQDRSHYLRYRDVHLLNGRRQNMAKFGLTIESYEQILEDQGGRCAICRAKPNGQRLSVDHCHKSQEVRGLLCQSCNNGLGRFRDNPDRLIAAAEYVGL